MRYNALALLFVLKYRRSVAQLVERWSPKPEVAGSTPVAPAISDYAEYR